MGIPFKKVLPYLLSGLNHADDLTHEVQVDIVLREGNEQKETISILPELSQTLQALARSRGVSMETLVNVWLTEKVLELSA